MCYYDIPEDFCLRLEHLLPTEDSPRGGRPAGDVRTFLNAVHWILLTASYMTGSIWGIWGAENRIFLFQVLAEKRISEGYP